MRTYSKKDICILRCNLYSVRRQVRVSLWTLWEFIPNFLPNLPICKGVFVKLIVQSSNEIGYWRINIILVIRECYSDCFLAFRVYVQIYPKRRHSSFELLQWFPYDIWPVVVLINFTWSSIHRKTVTWAPKILFVKFQKLYWSNIDESKDLWIPHRPGNVSKLSKHRIAFWFYWLGKSLCLSMYSTYKHYWYH